MSNLNQTIAGTILQQLGGRQFLVMTGSKNLCFDDGGALTMHLTKNKAKAKYLRIELDENDTYTMIFRKQDKSYTFPIVEKVVGVYCDMLQSVFTQVTGLYTHL